MQRRLPIYDKAQESHYNLISALHKALRGSDVDAALYWLARMLEGGEDPRFIARRLVRFASEDIGMADPAALVQALAAWETYERLGSPEGELALVQCVVYLGSAPKSNALYRAEGAACRLARTTGSLMPPKHALNAPTRMMQDLGYGRGYVYDHDTDEAFADYLKRSQNSEENMRDDLKRNMLRDRVVEKLSGEVAVADDEIKKYYDENIARFKDREQIKASRILIRVPPNATDADKKKAKQKAQQVLTSAKKANADFAKLARENSGGPEASRDGDLSWLYRGRMPPEFDNVAFGLRVKSRRERPNGPRSAYPHPRPRARNGRTCTHRRQS